jgi:multisubunit Na+/H+ antiporter MnhC subunit
VFVAVVLGVPYLMVKTGMATWLVATSRVHPIIVGLALIVTGIPLFICAGRMFGRK